jgi:hypothetical protein
MVLTLVWRNLRPLIRTERTPQRIISNEFAATSLVTAPDLMTEIDAIVLPVEHGLVLNMTDLALTCPRLWPLRLQPRGSHTSGSCRR